MAYQNKIIDAAFHQTRISASLRVLAAVALSIIVGAAVAGRYGLVVAAAVGAIGVAAIACVRPRIFGVALIAMLLIPYTWSPTITSVPVTVVVLFALPAGIAAGTIVLLDRSRYLKLCALDYLVFGLIFSAFLSEIATVGGGILGKDTLSRGEIEAILLPYLSFRLIFVTWPTIIPKIPNALIIVGAGLSLIAIWEELTRTNIFAHSKLNNPNLASWAVEYPRGGGVRATATMGHPIALGSFLLIPLVFAFAQRRWKPFMLIAAGEALTLSRGPYVAVLVALLLYAALTQRIGRLGVILVVIAILAFFVGPIRDSVSNSFQGGTIEQANANYRSELLSTSLSSLKLWGQPIGEANELYTHGQINLKDVTSEFALLSGRQGVPGLLLWIGFLAAFGGIIRKAQQRKDPFLLTLGVILVGEWTALLSVALITTLQPMFWLMVALTASCLTVQQTRDRGVASGPVGSLRADPTLP